MKFVVRLQNTVEILNRQVYRKFMIRILEQLKKKSTNRFATNIELGPYPAKHKNTVYN